MQRSFSTELRASCHKLKAEEVCDSSIRGRPAVLSTRQVHMQDQTTDAERTSAEELSLLAHTDKILRTLNGDLNRMQFPTAATILRHSTT